MEQRSHKKLHSVTLPSPGLALQLAELLGGPGGERLGLGGFGAPALRQQVVDEWANLHQLHHIFAKRCAQVAKETHTYTQTNK